MNELERAKLLVKSSELEKKRDELRRRLADKQQFHSAAWAEYGSELCAGGMQNEEAAIQKEIDAVVTELALVLDALAGKIDLSSETLAALRHESAEAQAQADAGASRLAESSAKSEVIERLRGYIK